MSSKDRLARVERAMGGAGGTCATCGKSLGRGGTYLDLVTDALEVDPPGEGPAMCSCPEKGDGYRGMVRERMEARAGERVQAEREAGGPIPCDRCGGVFSLSYLGWADTIGREVPGACSCDGASFVAWREARDRLAARMAISGA